MQVQKYDYVLFLLNTKVSHLKKPKTKTKTNKKKKTRY